MDELSQQSPPPPPPPPYAAPLPPAQESKRVVAGVFGILLGSLGIHKFVLGYTSEGLIMLLCTVLTCGILGFVFHTIGLIEGIVYLTKTDAEFVAIYQVGRRGWF